MISALKSVILNLPEGRSLKRIVPSLSVLIAYRPSSKITAREQASKLRFRLRLRLKLE